MTEVKNFSEIGKIGFLLEAFGAKVWPAPEHAGQHTTMRNLIMVFV